MYSVQLVRVLLHPLALVQLLAMPLLPALSALEVLLLPLQLV